MRAARAIACCIWAVIVGALTAIAPPPPKVTVLKYSDGGVAARLYRLEDGGAIKEYPDGGTVALPIVNEACPVDAGKLEQLLGQDRCERDSDCITFAPHVSVSSLKCCYVARRDVVKSAAFSAAYQEIVDRCDSLAGKIIRDRSSCEEWCSAAVCREGRCDVRVRPE